MLIVFAKILYQNYDFVKENCKVRANDFMDKPSKKKRLFLEK